MTKTARKRSAGDAFGRLAAQSAAKGPKVRKAGDSSEVRTGVLSVPCPLCSEAAGGSAQGQKKFAIGGRGLAAHLHAAHTPWKPTKLSRKLAKRQWQRKQRQSKSPLPPYQPAEPFTPTSEQIEDWERNVAGIVQQAEDEYLGASDSSNPYSTSTKAENTATTIYVNDSSEHSFEVPVSYTDSLPPFLKAAAEGRMETLQRMIACDKEILVQTDRHGSTAEHWAAGGGHLQCLKLLMEHRPQEKSTATKRLGRRDGKTPMHYAARNGQLHIVRYLVEEKGIEPHTLLSGEGTTPFHMACYGGHLSVVKYLAELFESSPDKRSDHPAVVANDWGCTSAHWVAMTIQPDADAVKELCTYLEEEGEVDFGARQSQGHSALHKAAQKGNRHVLEWLATRTLSKEAAAPDNGGHRPSDIWRSMSGLRRKRNGKTNTQQAEEDEKVAPWMEGLGW